MKKITLLLCAIVMSIASLANDGVYYASGNQLIPITETEIKVQKEYLSITRQENKLLIHVYYEFFNPGEEKTLLVGFEAMSPGGAWDIEEADFKKLTTHPYIHDFTVTINEQDVPYQVSHVDNSDGNYYTNGKFNEMNDQRALQLAQESYFMEIPYLFVYHFNATFKKGLNFVEHTYTFDESGYVGAEYCFDYVLTAANRWANNQIDDFTLDLDLGSHSTFDINESFFDGMEDWVVEGMGRMQELERYENKILRFHIQEGNATFHTTDFHPNGELYVERPFFFNDDFFDYESEDADCKRIVAFEFKDAYTSAIRIFDEPKDVHCTFSADMVKIMRNLPFAYRGYVFKTKMLQDYYESTAWYVADPDYVSDMNGLSESERKWVDFWTRQQKK